jgi:uncharacterized cupredoxin-like copper-binding protein
VSLFRLSIAGLAATAALGIAACGDDNKSDNSSNSGSTSKDKAAATTGSAGSSLKVVETEFKLSPANPSVAKAGTVTIRATNAGKVAHALEVEGPNGEAKTGTIDPGKTAKLKVDLSKAGTYEWYCPIDGHKASGMKGEIKVAGGGSGTAKKDEDSGGSGGSSGY